MAFMIINDHYCYLLIIIVEIFIAHRQGVSGGSQAKI